MTPFRPAPPPILGDSEMAGRIRAFDWSSTPVGDSDSWPQSLRTAVGICLGSPHQLAIYWGPDLVLLYNDAEIEALGSLHPGALGRPAREVLAEVWDDVNPLLQRVLALGEATTSRDEPLTFHRHGALEELYFTWSYSPLPDDDGEVGGVLLVTTETTEQVLRTRRLGLLRAVAASLLEAASVESACRLGCQTLEGAIPDVQFAAVYLADETAPAGAPRLAGAAGIGLTIGKPDIAGCRPDSLWPLADVLASGTSQEVGRIPGTATAWRSERGPQRAFAVPFPKTGRTGVAGVLVIGLDPLRSLDASYRDFLELLGAEFGAAIADAAGRELQQRRAAALEDLDREKNAFFGDVSHELRTPITLILASLADALEGTPDAHTRELVEVAARNARRLARLVNSLIDFAQIDSGGLHRAYSPTDLASVTSGISSSFRSAVERAGLRLRVECTPLGDPVYVDVEAWEKIVLNLLSNAFKFTFSGEIAVALQRVDGMAELTVSDTGVGIPEQELPRLFERFRRVRGTSARSHDGVGIGLALVQELVGLHGGDVEVESRLGTGTTVRVRIPFGRAHLPPPQVVAAGTDAIPAALVEGAIEDAERWHPDRRARLALDDLTGPDVPHVLVADDNADLRSYLERLLGSRWRVTTAVDGASALAQIRNQPPDLVLADLMMPGLDGLSLLRTLRADPQTEDLPVIVLTARADDATAEEVLGAGADDYIAKPFTGRELVARIGASIDVTRLHRDAARSLAEVELARSSLDRLARLQTVTASLAMASSPQEIARVVVNEGANALRAQGGVVAFAAPGGELEVVASRGYATPLEDSGQAGANASAALAGAFRTGGSIIVGDALIATPLQGGSHARGAVAFSFESPHTVTPEAERFVDLLAQQCGLALDRAERTSGHAAELERLLGELRAAQARTLAAADAERRRIERDIHDGAQQQIVAVRVKLSLAESALGVNDPAQAARARGMVVESGRELEGALHDLRRLAHGVFPRLLADEGLPSALSAAARQATLPASVEIDGVGRLPVDIESAVYFCCHEALQNAAKHAGPGARATIRLSFDGTGALEVEISDDGSGFDTGSTAVGGGLTNMWDRVQACRGTLSVESDRATGTRIRARIPL
jgi:signal transduction histidine kinase